MTYVCLTNDEKIIVSISTKEKKLLKIFFRELNKPLIFKLFTFSVLCAKAIMLSKTKTVFIDREYSGHERQIKLFILQIFKIDKFSEVDVNFCEIGKQANAHLRVYEAMIKKQKGIIVETKDVLGYFNKIDKP